MLSQKAQANGQGGTGFPAITKINNIFGAFLSDLSKK